MKINHAKLRRKMRGRLSGAAFLAPSFLGAAIFYILPFGVVVYYSLIKSPLVREFVGFENFVNVLNNSSFRMAAANTLKFSAVAVPLAVILAILLALMLECKIPAKSQLRTFFLSPMMVPVASIVLIWQVIFHYNGVLNNFLSIFGYDKIDWFKSDYGQIPIIVLFLWKNLGYNMILFMAALNNMPKGLLEVARVEGAGPVYCFFNIKLRYLSPTVLFVTILSLINSFKVFREVYLLTGDYPFDGLYLMQHFMNNMFKSLDYQKLSAAAILMALVMIVIVGILFLVESRYGKDVEG